MNNSVEIEASLHSEAELTILNADRNVEKQIQQIEQLIAMPVDVLIVSPLVSEALTPVIDKAYKSDIPVILVDRKVNSQNYTSYLGADNTEVGEIAGKYLVALSNGKADVIEINAEMSTSPGRERSNGFRRVIDNYPDIQLLTAVSATDSRLDGTYFEGVIKSHPSVNYIFAFNDDLASQAYKIVRSMGLEDRIRIIGVDGLNGPNGGIQMVKDGTLKATVLYPTGGSEAVKLALQAAKKSSIPKNFVLNTIVIDSLNADIMKNQLDKVSSQQRDIEQQHTVIEEQKKQYSSLNNLLRILTAAMIVILILAIYSIYSMMQIKKKNRLLRLNNEKILTQRNQIEKIADKLKESNEAKVNFFTGISHEFKTPITLILSALESFTHNKTIQKMQVSDELELINNNALRLLRLINQLLSFRKIEDKNFNLRVSSTNIFNFSKRIVGDFKREAEARGIELKLETNNENLELMFDRNLMDQIYFNLLSNAFKFTPNNGWICIDIVDQQDGNKAEIRFKDSGIGIPEAELNQLFQPFYQGSNHNKTSSGIGLHLTKHFVELHKGHIKVISKRGTEFVLTFMKGDAHLDQNCIIAEPDRIHEEIIETNSVPTFESALEANLEEHDSDYEVLIIEDNIDLVGFLRGKLLKNFKIYTSDGTDAIDKAIEKVPDLIICDVNLPEKNGFEISRILKNDLRTSHIPIIMLTGLSQNESVLEGMRSGVDMYLTKPFSLAVLMQSISTVLYNRERLRYYYTNNIHKIGNTSEFGLGDQEFLTRANQIIKDHIDDSKFSVESLAETLEISRVQLYRKMKAILGVNISDYINDIRLEHAKELLQETKLAVSEVAYSSGFSSPNYFSTAFKNKYGMTPNTFKRSK
jgi:signal transduction histidine kinase/AraC-like DNA-binding protein